MVRRNRPDACLIAFDQGTAAHVVAKLSGARIRVGGNLGRIRIRRSVTREVRMPDDERPVTWNWQMARALAGSLGRDAGWPAEPPPPDFRHLIRQGARPRGDRRRVVVHSGTSRPLNRWPGERFASVASALARDFEVVWIMHADTTGPAPAGTTPAVVDSLSALAQWLANADLFLGNNSGPMHLASALGCAGVAVTGPSAIGWDPYWNREGWTVLRHPDLYCAPCEASSIEVTSCANLGSPMACLRYWTEEKVEAACRLRLGQMEGLRP
jgi:ADP-heptose:LPS heptosyltransferase